MTKVIKYDKANRVIYTSQVTSRMLAQALLNPKSILVVGGSNNVDHLGGSVLKNLIDCGFPGELCVLNPKRERVQGLRSYSVPEEVPDVELAIFAIPAHEIYPVMRVLIEQKGTKAFLVYSAGFSELDEEGKRLEKEILELVDNSGCSLLGPNNIGMVNTNYAGIFTKPIPKLDPKGVDYVSGSGATAVFTLEAARQTGLTFNSLITVGNSAQIGIEEVLEHWDETHDQENGSQVKMVYMETVRKPGKFLKHCLSLREKGCRIVGLKSGSTPKGSEAAASHTGAMASPDLFVQALMDKAGVIRCHSRYALITIAGLLQLTKEPVTKIAVITHAGGPGVILTDHLVRNGLDVPTFEARHKEALRDILNPGAAVGNPIDLLATGTALQLKTVIEYCDEKVDQVDGIAVIFGSPGLGSVHEAYEVIRSKMFACQKPVFPVLPSVVNLKDEIEEFVKEGHIAFFDESLLGRGLGKIAKTPVPYKNVPELPPETSQKIRSMISRLPSGFIEDREAFKLIELLGIETPAQVFVDLDRQIPDLPSNMRYPVAVKATGILHKTDEKALELNIRSDKELADAQKRLGRVPGAKGLMVQEMHQGTELFVGSQSIPNYPPLVVFGAGGIFLESFRDITQSLAPIDPEEAATQIKSLKIYPVLEGSRGQTPVDIARYAHIISLISQLVCAEPRIAELDLNPLIAGPQGITAVDVRIRLDS